jgi:YesN/AraC family two-component response regulator
VKESIDLIIECIVKEQYSIESVREYIIFAATYLAKLTYDMGYNEQEVFGGNIIQVFSMVSSIDELKIKMNNYSLRFVDFLETEKSMRKSVLIQQVMKYMRENKENDLSLIVVADSAGVSPSFLSKVFKDETGIKFVDYSIQLKLEYAKTLLERKNISTEEVSLKVGYSQPQYFIKKFKAQYGITPKQYQMRFLNELNLDG